jgi:thiamine-phosphate diphosphorylase
LKGFFKEKQQSQKNPIPALEGFPLLNVIIGGPLCRGRDYAELTRSVVEGGAGLVQLREKNKDARQIVETARRMQSVCRKNNALFVVNDRVDVAFAAGADGVHLGQDDISLTMARKILGPDKIIGISVQNLDQAKAAVAEGADYLGLGPAFHTDSKECNRPAGGACLISEIAPMVKIPVLAIAGITPENTLPLLEAGASGVAVISSVLENPDPKEIVLKFMKIFKDRQLSKTI